MIVDPKTSPKWLCDMHRELLRGRQVLLYGNVSDEFQVSIENDDYVNLADFLHRYLLEEGFQIVGRYDLVDGFVWADQARMSPLVQQVITGRVPVPVEAESTREPARATGAPGATAPSSNPRTVSSALSRRLDTPSAPVAGRGDVIALDPALRMTRTLVGNTNIATALTICFSDRLVSDPQHQTTQELPALILIRKIIEEAAILRAGTLRYRRNCCVFVADRLEGIPAWLYQENPLLALIPVGRPTGEERRLFIQRTLTKFHGTEAYRPDEQGEPMVREFETMTDGLTTRDLRAIQRTSVMERLPATQMKVLIDRYRYGQQENPWEKLDDRIRTAREDLEKRVIGQSDAVTAVVEMLVTARAGLTLTPSSRSGKPKGVFFFVGSTGVGKTELAKSLTAQIFGDESAYARFDMSEYSLEHASEKLTGSPPGYVGYGDGGQLTRRVIERPFSLILFDEIEKAHPSIMDKFLQVLDDGRLTDSRGQTADFSQCVIVFTSNIGSTAVMKELQDGLVSNPGNAKGVAKLPPYSKIRDQFKEAVRQHFLTPPPQGLGRPELLNRLGDNVLVFDILRPESIPLIARKLLENLRVSAQEQGVGLQMDIQQIAQMIAEMMMEDPKNLMMGGRQVRTLTETFVLKPLSRYLFEHNLSKGAVLSVHTAPGMRTVRIERSHRERQDG